MTLLEIARQFAEAGAARDACRAYALAASDGAAAPEDRMEAALYILQAGDNYRISYLCLLDLYGKGVERENILPLLTEAFYEPNLPDLRRRYRENCRLLKKYPYCFRKDFPAFEDLPIRFYPFDEGQYVPFYGAEGRFDGVTEPGEPVVRHWFFQDLERPVRADDLFSQYELEYLCDSVRKSEYIGRDNHVYLCYADWETFCAWLSVLDMEPVLREKKAVFLFGEERGEYPLDFAARFGVDYSRYPRKPVGIREVNRMIWHVQFSTHNGGDFFNEIFDSHPNLLMMPSIFLTTVQEYIDTVRAILRTCGSPEEAGKRLAVWCNPALAEELYRLKHPTSKDLLAAVYLAGATNGRQFGTYADPDSRLAPIIFFQPHFPNLGIRIRVSDTNYAVLESRRLDEIRNSGVFRDFRYLKVFIPMRRFTTSYGGAMGFMDRNRYEVELNRENPVMVDDLALARVMNRSFMRDPAERLYRDSVMVRLEDGKLNPRATFTALARFLDIPYTESMTYCSEGGARDPHTDWENYAPGFSLKSVYATYDEYCGDNERVFMEYFLRDAYRFYGYGFQYWDGRAMDEAAATKLAEGFSTEEAVLKKIQMTYWTRELTNEGERDLTREEREELETRWREIWKQMEDARKQAACSLCRELRYVNRDGLPLSMIPLLEPDPDLLEKPIYH